MEEAASKTPYGPKSKVAYADPGYQDDKQARYPVDTVQHARAAWSYINQKKNAGQYTANQLKRIKDRIAKALKKFGVEVNTKEHYLVLSGDVTESTLSEFHLAVAESDSGSFCVNLTNGPVNITISSYCVDPADLDVIGRAAMAAACSALADLDPDMDGDMDVPGADAEDTDDDMESAAPPAAGRHAAETTSAQDPVAPAVVETAPETPANLPAADITETKKESLVSDETTTPAATEQPAPAVEPAAAPAAPAGVMLSNEQFAQLLAAATAPRPAASELVGAGAPAETAAAPAAPVTEAVPAAAAAPAVTETDEQRIARLVAEGVKAALPTAVQEHVERYGPPSRKGFVRGAVNPVTESGSDGDVLAAELGDQWPTRNGVPLQPHELSRDQFSSIAGPQLEQYYLGSRARQQ